MKGALKDAEAREICLLLWQGYKVIDDNRSRCYIFVSADGDDHKILNRELVDLVVRERYARRVIYADADHKDQPGLALTQLGLVLIGKDQAVEDIGEC